MEINFDTITKMQQTIQAHKQTKNLSQSMQTDIIKTPKSDTSQKFIP